METTRKVWQERLIGFTKAGTSLTVIISAVLLLELIFLGMWCCFCS